MMPIDLSQIGNSLISTSISNFPSMCRPSTKSHRDERLNEIGDLWQKSNNFRKTNKKFAKTQIRMINKLKKKWSGMTKSVNKEIDLLNKNHK